MFYECNNTDCHYDDCHNAERHHAECHGAWRPKNIKVFLIFLSLSNLKLINMIFKSGTTVRAVKQL
jgi:hypothetical protein